MSDKTVKLPPHPAYLMQSMRCIGYTLETALADIIDNSLAANATSISVQYRWNNGSPWLSVLDNGCGMSGAELHEAMRFGGADSPLSIRTKKDLGRFGLGLKTASLSQSRLLTVISRQNGRISALSWDVDYLVRNNSSEWQAIIPEIEKLENETAISQLLEKLVTFGTGTLVIWQNTDFIASDEQKFSETMSRVRKHVETVFHRFMSIEHAPRPVKLDFNETPLIPFNPFGPNHPARQELTAEKITLHGEDILVQPYVLPHFSKIERKIYEQFGGDDGYLHNQGFYVYRNKRLIVKGTWFRLTPKTELTKLLRVRVDIPNTLDHLWRLDVKKSQAHPPQIVLDELKRIIGKITDAGKKVHTRRAAQLKAEITSIWQRIVSDGKICYVINEKHPFVKNLLSDAGGFQDNHKLAIMRVISDAFPRQSFYVDAANDKNELVDSASDEQRFSAVRDLINALCASGLTIDDLKTQLKHTQLPVSDEELKKILMENIHA